MKFSYTNRCRASFWLVGVMVLAQLAALAALPQPAAAANEVDPAAEVAPTVTSADPAEEIVYIDDAGVIHVLDTQGDPLVDWQSPTDGWTHVTMGDFNNDGDQEIAALAEDPDIVRVGVFDPVVFQGATDPDKKINGIPWDTLYTTEFPGRPDYIVAGNFDPNVPGDELAIGFRDGVNNHYLRIWKAASLDNQGNPTGREWTPHISVDWEDREGQQFARADAGQIVDEGPDELVLVDEDSVETLIAVYSMEDGFIQLDERTTDTDRWRQPYVGQFIEGDGEEVAARLSVDRVDKRSIIVHEWDDELDTDDDWQWAFAPQAEDIFGADLFNNGDLELFILRQHPDRNGIRLIMRDDWGDDRDRVEIEYDLDVGDDDDDDDTNYDDAGFEKGEGGDLDGDGNDEIVLLRDDLIRVFTRPEDRIEDESYWVDYDVDTNGEKPLVGDVDTNGFIEGPSFAVDRNAINASVPVGTVSGNYPIQVTNRTTDDRIQFGASIPFGDNWARVNPTFAPTPATLNVQFDATNLAIGTYETTMTLQAPNQDVLNEPFLINLQLDVLPATIIPQAYPVNMTVDACETITDSANFEPMTSTLKIRGTNDLNYRAAVIAVPDSDDAAAAANASADAQGGAITGGEIAENGDMILYDASGNRRTIPMNSGADGAGSPGEVSASAVLSTSWPIDASAEWITSVHSNVPQVPSDITITVDPSVLEPDFATQRALLVMVADTRAGTPPENLFSVPIALMCTNNSIYTPSLHR